ncbi:MAG: hypothetical protein O6853_06910, partial [Actinobacteria bacterium]|nr:hypothetical protein [Actinomycetota bacterium]
MRAYRLMPLLSQPGSLPSEAARSLSWRSIEGIWIRIGHTSSQAPHMVDAYGSSHQGSIHCKP